MTAYRVVTSYEGGPDWEADDPYRHTPTIGELDLHLIREGRHEELWRVLGAHVREHGGTQGTSFTVWAPNARAVRVLGDFNGWYGNNHAMRSMGGTGVWELFVPGIAAGATYKFELLSRHGGWVTKADPMARFAEVPPATASVVTESAYSWADGEWMSRRAKSTPVSRADVGLRGAPRLVATRPVVPRRRRPAHRLRLRPGLHPHRVPAARRAPVRRIVGLPGDGLLRPDEPLRSAR